ncbi:hypothetical protein SeLEV6574_g06337 [Synchytrium endobioticum]|nr:hypothetical protein SeLEV6574_g06337 [Synchytrium endobioticum]
MGSEADADADAEAAVGRPNSQTAEPTIWKSRLDTPMAELPALLSLLSLHDDARPPYRNHASTQHSDEACSNSRQPSTPSSSPPCDHRPSHHYDSNATTFVTPGMPMSMPMPMPRTSSSTALVHRHPSWHRRAGVPHALPYPFRIRVATPSNGIPRVSSHAIPKSRRMTSHLLHASASCLERHSFAAAHMPCHNNRAVRRKGRARRGSFDTLSRHRSPPVPVDFFSPDLTDALSSLSNVASMTTIRNRRCLVRSHSDSGITSSSRTMHRSATPDMSKLALLCDDGSTETPLTSIRPSRFIVSSSPTPSSSSAASSHESSESVTMSAVMEDHHSYRAEGAGNSTYSAAFSPTHPGEFDDYGRELSVLLQHVDLSRDATLTYIA